MSSQKLNQAKIYLLAFSNQYLKDFCKTYKIKGFSKLNKEEIIDLILNSISKTDFDSFLQDIEEKSLISIISLVPKYFLKENPTKLDNLSFDKKNNLLRLNFKGFRWEIATQIHFHNLIANKEPLKFNYKCDCEYAKDGGFCSHFWVGLLWVFQKFSLQNSRWNKTKLPEIFNQLKIRLNFAPYNKEISKSDKADMLSVEEFLKIKLMGKTQFDYNDLEDLSIKELLTFISQLNIKISEEEQIKPKKSKLITLIKNQRGIEEFSKAFFEFKKNFRIAEAKKIPIEITNIEWGPPLNCQARLKIFENEKEEIVNIIVKNNQINHSNCHWVYHRQNFCGHLIALFLNLSNKNPIKIIEFLKSYLRE
ncbi:MAG: hypothetical protein ACFE9S_05730 [Candidatus Hermodarchaeota archaeon]